ncbi:MAG: hypothetical protein OEQ47_14180 [Acidimicrobiia bacterium]|nr:hypothetical protein [Acidimicrobiia bacterium]MDH3462496.1 hypothetical protein [Acidimicrobiia bacterium]
MTRYTIDQHTDGLTIRLTETGTGTDQLLGLLQDCQEGRCDCPTDEYEKVSSLSVERHDDDVVMMQLRPKPGARLDESEVRACIQHTIDKTRS